MKRAEKLFRPRVTDIAHRAGVSTATVSRALNSSMLVRPDVRQRVLEVAKELNYRLNPAARDLGRNRSSLILMAVGDPAELTLSQSVLMRSLASRILGRGEFPVLIADDESDSPAQPGKMDILAAAAGAICLGEGAVLSRLGAYGIPTVVVDASTQTRQSHIRLNRRGGYRRVAEHLLERGHRRVGFVGRESDTKFEALSEVVSGAGARCSAVASDTLAAFVALETPLDRISAWVLPGETLVVTVVSILAAAGRRIGADTAVVAQGDTYLAQRCWPPLTALRHPDELISNIAMDLLQAAQKDPDRNHAATLELELVLRPSSAFMHIQEP